MATYQFVDSISATPTLRLDLNTKPWTTLTGTDFGFPEMRRAVSSTLLADGEQIAASAYGNRTLRLNLMVDTATVDATAVELQKLARELNRPTNILKTQMGAAPVFFRTYRSAPESWQIITTGARVTIDAAVPAEPFALGLQETPTSNVTINSDPAGGGNACFVDVTGVKGDVETPAYIRWPNPASTIETVFAVRRRGTPSAAPFLFQAEAMTQGTDTTTQVNDANFSGTGNNYSRCTFATATMQTRLSITDIGAVGADLRGEYRVFWRYRKNTASNDINLQLRWGESGNVVNDPYVTPEDNIIQAADLGIISIPGGADPVTDPSGVELSVSDQFSIELRAERLVGSGTMDFDLMLLVPADDRFAVVRIPPPATVDHWMLNAQTNNAHAQDSSGRAVNARSAEPTGGFPMLTPNQTNRITMLRNVGRSSAWTLTTTTNVYVHYWPRYLSIRPATT